MRTLSVVLVGMVVVFASLTLLILCIKVYSSIIVMFRNRKNNNHNNSNVQKKGIQIKDKAETTIATVNSESASEGINSELIAVIAAAIAACMSGSGTGFRVRSIKRVGHTTPVWNVAGRNEYILSKL